MGFLTLLQVASMPIIQVLLISLLGAFLASDYLNIFPKETRKSLNKIVYMVFTPCLMFASLTQTMTFKYLISWWFMPINVGLTFLFGGILGWIAVKIVKPKPYLEGLIIATCSSGNLGNLVLIVVPAICSEDGSPFDNSKACRTVGLSYASFSMALGGFFIWTYTFQLVRTSAMKYKALTKSEEITKVPNRDLDANEETRLLNGENQQVKSLQNDPENQMVRQGALSKADRGNVSCWSNFKVTVQQIVHELMAPPTLSASIGFAFGATPWLKHLLVGSTAPLRVIQDSIQLLGNGTIPCITLILGGNLIQGLKAAKVRPTSILAVICVRFIFLPIIGIGVVKAADALGLLPSDTLFQFVLMLQFALPPAMNISTMTELFDVAQEECSVIMMWTYLVACLALTMWSTVFMSIST